MTANKDEIDEYKSWRDNAVRFFRSIGNHESAESLKSEEITPDVLEWFRRFKDQERKHLIETFGKSAV